MQDVHNEEQTEGEREKAFIIFTGVSELMATIWDNQTFSFSIIFFKCENLTINSFKVTYASQLKGTIYYVWKCSGLYQIDKSIRQSTLNTLKLIY